MSYHLPANFLVVWASHATNTDTAIAPTNTNCSSSFRSPCLRRPCRLDFTRAVYGGLLFCAGTSYGALWAVRVQGGRGRILLPRVPLLPGRPPSTSPSRGGCTGPHGCGCGCGRGSAGLHRPLRRSVTGRRPVRVRRHGVVRDGQPRPDGGRRPRHASPARRAQVCLAENPRAPRRRPR
jgi:hypothetical protein